MSETQNTPEITEAVGIKVRDLVSFGLVKGVGKPIAGQMCVEAAVNYALGGEHNDRPSCVGSAVRAFKIRLNDSNWSSAQARARGLRDLAIAQLGTKGVLENGQFLQ